MVQKCQADVQKSFAEILKGSNEITKLQEQENVAINICKKDRDVMRKSKQLLQETVDVNNPNLFFGSQEKEIKTETGRENEELID